jgi:phage repressor protein C with HTH and peptisase S24 domain
MQQNIDKNSSKLELIRERIIFIADNKEVSREKFLMKTGLKKGIFDRKDINRAVGSDKISNIIESYPDVNINWLITGKEQVPSYNNHQEPNKIFNFRTDNKVDYQTIPLYNIGASTGLVDLFQSHTDITPIETISIPNLPKCDGALHVTGDSMCPLLKSGDIIAYKQIHDKASEIFWGEMYLISVEVSGEEYICVKYIQKSEKGDQYIKLVSKNQHHHQDKSVHLDKVRALALIKASIRMHSMK